MKYPLNIEKMVQKEGKGLPPEMQDYLRRMYAEVNRAFYFGVIRQRRDVYCNRFSRLCREVDKNVGFPNSLRFHKAIAETALECEKAYAAGYNGG